MKTPSKSEPVGDTIDWQLENTYCELPSSLYADVQPARFENPHLAVFNDRLASELGFTFNHSQSEQLAAIFSGQQLAPGSRPIAQAYAGHQYGGFTMLGDGRAILLGEKRTPVGALVDIQLKGSGPTPFSRRGDGLAALGPMLREYIISEAMHGLGIPTTQSLAVVTTGEAVYRETAMHGAVLTRTAASHLRVGTFQYVAALQEPETLVALADYAIQRHFPEIPNDTNKYTQFLKAVCERQVELVAKWQLVGFVHGVMNTDNVTISGETIDYGPCAFMDAYDPSTVFSSIDHGGRYAYGNQPQICQWNLTRFAETLLPLIDNDIDKAIDIAKHILADAAHHFQSCLLAGMRRKLGLTSQQDGDQSLIDDLLRWMQSTQADYTNTFDDLTCQETLDDCIYRDPNFQAWHDRWIQRLAQDNTDRLSVRAIMATANPAIIPRNHRVEESLETATRDGNLSPMLDLVRHLANPFVRSSESKLLREPANDGGRYRTFCGT